MDAAHVEESEETFGSESGGGDVGFSACHVDGACENDRDWTILSDGSLRRRRRPPPSFHFWTTTTPMEPLTMEGTRQRQQHVQQQQQLQQQLLSCTEVVHDWMLDRVHSEIRDEATREAVGPDAGQAEQGDAGRADSAVAAYPATGAGGPDSAVAAPAEPAPAAAPAYGDVPDPPVELCVAEPVAEELRGVPRGGRYGDLTMLTTSMAASGLLTAHRVTAMAARFVRHGWLI